MQYVAVLGASNNPDRYSYMAVELLKKFGHNVVPVSPNEDTILGLKVVKNLSEITHPLDTLTMYVKPEISTKLSDEILKLNPKRVIFNPGTENDHLQKNLKAQGIEVLEACTLVLLRTNQFE
jgi:predicted CoA-binding protein